MSTCGQTLSRICLNPRQSTSTTSAFLPYLQTRHESTTRRHRKLLALPEAPSFTPDRSSPTLIFNPPSAAPSVYHTPLKFLPKEDKRRALYAAQADASRIAHNRQTPNIATPGTPLHTTAFSRPPNAPNATPSAAFLPPRPSASLPPAVRSPYEKKYHLKAEDILEIQRLRLADPEHWTRVRLAEKFGCSQFFVGMVAKNEAKAERVEKEHEKARRRWGKQRTMAREDRGRRKLLWGRDA